MGGWLAHDAFADRLGTQSMTDEKAIHQLTRMQGVSADLVPANYPMLVHFQKIDNPQTVEQVNPATLSVAFGPGVHLKRIMIQTVEDGVTEEIKKRLPWLANQRGALLQRPKGTPIGEMPLAGRLTEGEFIKGVSK